MLVKRELSPGQTALLPFLSAPHGPSTFASAAPSAWSGSSSLFPARFPSSSVSKNTTASQPLQPSSHLLLLLKHSPVTASCPFVFPCLPSPLEHKLHKGRDLGVPFACIPQQTPNEPNGPGLKSPFHFGFPSTSHRFCGARGASLCVWQGAVGAEILSCWKFRPKKPRSQGGGSVRFRATRPDSGLPSRQCCLRPRPLEAPPDAASRPGLPRALARGFLGQGGAGELRPGKVEEGPVPPSPRRVPGAPWSPGRLQKPWRRGRRM